MRRWSSVEAALRYYELEGFLIREMFCTHCGFTFTAALEADRSKFYECSRCHCYRAIIQNTML